MAIAVSTVFLLSACAGGGGGGGGPNNPGGGNLPPTQGSGGGSGGGGGGGNLTTSVYSSSQLANYNFTPGTRTQVPFATPTLVSTFNPFSSPTASDTVSAQYVVHDLTGDGGDDIIITGRQSQPATPSTWSNSSIQLFDWQNGKLVNDTAKWFPSGINSILGTDPTVQFADFFHTGHTDMFISPSTDMAYYGTTPYSQAWLYSNTGSQFNLTTINLGTQVWAHGASIADLTGSGYQDVLMTGYASNGILGGGTVFLMNNHVNGFTPYVVSNFATGASSIVAADFLGNGQTQVVVSDSCCTANMGSYKTTQMYSWNIDTNNVLSFNYIKNLPTPIFDLPQYSQYGGVPGSTHNYLLLVDDFIGNGIPDIIAFGAPVNGAKASAIQFLQNDGHGNFTDVTSSMLVGYNMNTYGSYHPQFIDLGNGQQSMIVSSTDWSGQNNSTQVLIKQSASGPYVAAFQNIITDFAAQANLIANINNSANEVAMVKDPSNNLYLVTTVQYRVNGQQMASTYLSLVGASVSTTSAQTAFNQVKAQWPWMSPAQVNQVLAQTASSYMTDAGPGLVLNPNNLLNPVGALGVYTRNGLLNLSGGITGVNLGNLSQIQAFDSLGRNFTVSFANSNIAGPNGFNTNTEAIDQYNITSHAEYLISGNANTVNTPMGLMRLGFETRNQFNTTGAPTPPPEFGDSSGNHGLYIGATLPKQWSFGLPEIYRNGNFSAGVQYTSLNTNPWVNFGGSFGSVTNSGTLESVATYLKDGFSVQGSVMRTTTNFVPGLVTNVAPITAAWGETGYRYTNDRFGDIGVYAGVMPVVLSGSVTANMPTSVDNSGNPVYTTNKMGIISTTTPYVRALYTGTIDRNSGYRLSGMTTNNGQYRALAEYRYVFN